MYPRRCIGRTRPPCHKRHARLSRKLSHSLRHDQSATLIPTKNGCNRFLIIKPVKRRKKTLSRYAKYSPAALNRELINQYFSTMTHIHVLPLMVRPVQLPMIIVLKAQPPDIIQFAGSKPCHIKFIHQKLAMKRV